jgi:hypothetical protein
VTGPARAIKGTSVTLTVGGTVGGTQGVSGTVEILRWNGKAWVRHWLVQVTNGKATATFPAQASRSYRAKALTVTGPELVTISAANTWSIPMAPMLVRPAKASATPRLTVPTHVKKGTAAAFGAQWKTPWSKGSKLTLQIRRDKKWVNVTNVTAKTFKTLKVTVAKTAKYRLVTASKATPSGKKKRVSATRKVWAF